jgi:poly-beta-1,6-N-acetyl-D-glucosamine biosynthesis protein PgaD
MNWPPLIVSTRKGRALLWRDRLLTASLWGAFSYLLVEQSVLFWSRVYHVRTVYPGAFVENWEFRLKPFALVSGALVAWLLLFGLLSLYKWKRMLRREERPPLSIQAEGERRGMTVEDIREARQQKIVTVAIDSHGVFAVVPQGPP